VRIFIFAVGALVLIGVFDEAALTCDDVFTLANKIHENRLRFAVGNKRMLNIYVHVTASHDTCEKRRLS
jgi:hypothetical protein